MSLVNETGQASRPLSFPEQSWLPRQSPSLDDLDEDQDRGARSPLPRNAGAANRLWEAVLLPIAGLAGGAAIIGPAPTSATSARAEVALLLILATGWCLALAVTRQRDRDRRRTGRLGVTALLAAGGQVGVLGSAAMWWFLPTFPVALFLGTLAGMLTASLAADLWLDRHGRPSQLEPTRLLVAGHQASAERAEVTLARDPGFAVQGRCLPTTAAILQALETIRVDAVIVLPCSHLDPAELRRLEWELADAGLDLMIATGLVDVRPGRARVTSVADLSMVHVRHSELRSWRRTLQHLVGRALAVAILCVTAPLLLALMLAVRLDSPGPAIFCQQRIGRDGRTFTMLKLRTMSLNPPPAEAVLVNDTDSVLFKMRRDPRITRVGVILRRYSLDELPQLMNVVRGEMALVGPRPALAHEVATYTTDVHRRLAVQPGITGLWQVSGRSDLAWDESVRLDLTYVDNWYPGSDLRILARTVVAVITHRGAY